MPRILYPKPIPRTDKRAPINENGFTLTEIAALQTGWRLIRQGLKHHARRLFMNFYQENYQILGRFRDKSGRLSLSRMHRHSEMMLRAYGNIIDYGLNDAVYIHVLLGDISQRHKAYGVTSDEIKLRTDTVLRYVFSELKKVTSSTFTGGFIKLSNLINAYHSDKSHVTDAGQNKSADSENT